MSDDRPVVSECSEHLALEEALNVTDLLHGGQDKAGKRPRGQWPQVVPAARTQCRVHPWRGASAAHATRIWSCSRSSTNTIEDAERIFYFPHNRFLRPLLLECEARV